MKRAALRACLILAGIAVCMPAGAQLYKWVDANGRVQYSDRPPAGQQAQKIGRSGVGAPPHPAEAASPTDKAGATASAEGNAAPSAQPASVAEQEQAFRKRRMEKEEAQQKQAKLDAEKRARDAQCQQTRNYLKSVEGGRRIVRTNDKGEEEYLDDTQIKQEAERARQLLASNCSS